MSELQVEANENQLLSQPDAISLEAVPLIDDYSATLDQVQLTKQNSSKLPPKGIPLGKSLKVRTQQHVAGDKKSPRNGTFEIFGERGVLSDGENGRSPKNEQHKTYSQKTESRKQDNLKAGPKVYASGRESQDFKIKTKRSQSKKNQPTTKVLPTVNTNSLIADTKNNKLIILPVTEPTYHRGKSATQSIVSLAQNEKIVINQQNHMQAIKQPMALRVNNGQRLLPPIT